LDFILDAVNSNCYSATAFLYGIRTPAFNLPPWSQRLNYGLVVRTMPGKYGVQIRRWLIRALGHR